MNNHILAVQADIDKYNKMFSKGENRMKTNKIALFVSIVVILVCLAMVDSVSAEEIGYYTNNYVMHFGVFPVKNDYIRSEACHTLVLWGGDESIESESCPMENNTDKKDKDTTSIVTIPDKPNNPPVVVDVPEPKAPTIIDTPKADKPKSNNGNHYGNTTPDNNDNDVKNKFNGQDNPHNH